MNTENGLITNLREWPSLPYPDSPRSIRELMRQAANTLEAEAQENKRLRDMQPGILRQLHQEIEDRDAAEARTETLVAECGRLREALEKAANRFECCDLEDPALKAMRPFRRYCEEARAALTPGPAQEREEKYPGLSHVADEAYRMAAQNIAQKERRAAGKQPRGGEAGKHYWSDDRHKVEVEQAEAQGYQRGVDEKIQADEEMMIELANQVSKYEIQNQRLLEVLSEIKKGEGKYNRDPLIHAGNCIENMKKIALAALAQQMEQPQDGAGERVNG